MDLTRLLCSFTISPPLKHQSLRIQVGTEVMTFEGAKQVIRGGESMLPGVFSFPFSFSTVQKMSVKVMQSDKVVASTEARVGSIMEERQASLKVGPSWTVTVTVEEENKAWGIDQHNGGGGGMPDPMSLMVCVCLFIFFPPFSNSHSQG